MKFALSPLALLVLATLPLMASAQVNPLSTTAGFKAACERNPGNVVQITTDMAVNQGYPSGYPERVNTGCTIVLVGDSEIQFDKVGLAFAGPLVITGGSKTGVAMQQAGLSAPSVRMDFSGDEGYLRTSFSRIDATAGDVNITLGRIGQMELFNYITGGVPLTRATIAATGLVNITAGERLSASMNEVGIVAGGDLRFTATGSESSLKLENSGFLTYRGNLAVMMLGAKSKLEAGNSNLLAQFANIEVMLAQAESGMSLSNMTVNAVGSTQLVTAGTKSELGISNGTIRAGGGIFLSAAAGSTEGSLKVEGVGMSATTPVRLVTGVQGKTVANNNRIGGTGLVEFSTAPGSGLCEAVGNIITAPTQSICR